MSSKQASDALLKGIEHIVTTKIKKASVDKTFTGIIKQIKNDNLYDVEMQGQVYEDIPSIFSNLSQNSIVKIKIPQGQYSSMYIEGSFNMDFLTNGTKENDYRTLENLPQINGITLIDNKTLEEIGIETITNIEIENIFN